MKIVLTSRNKNKIRELETLLRSLTSKEIEILSLDDIGFKDDIAETGSAFEENAMLKAKTAAELGYIGIADDSGLEVDYLNGAPGIYSARYSGEHANDERNNRKLLSELEGVPYEKRTARFVSVVVCVFPDGRKPITARGTCEGVILESPAGENGFGYDPLFYYEPFKKSFAQLSSDEKNAVSHRGKAMRKFAESFVKTLL